MTDRIFCYCCRVHHAKDQMRLYQTKRGARWRCLRSIEVAGFNRTERDALGRRQTAINREQASRQAEFSRRLRDISCPG